METDVKDCPSKLELISTEELLVELGERFDHSVFAALRVCDIKGNEPTLDWFGDEYMCKGLTVSLLEQIKDDCDVMDMEDEEDEDDECD